jgi:deazaflavin-dependent oxidoreductase (nitroreductase family)
MAQNPFMSIGNLIIQKLLKSQLHGMMSGSTMLVTFQGQKSGKTYTTPVNYLQDGEILYTTSSRERTWWRNLRGGKEVTLRLRGMDVKATGEVVEDDDGVTAQLGVYLAKRPDYARLFGVSFTSEGKINLPEVQQAAKTRVMVLFQLKQEQPILLKVIS